MAGLEPQKHTIEIITDTENDPVDAITHNVEARTLMIGVLPFGEVA
jgi:hypothetical protein